MVDTKMLLHFLEKKLLIIGREVVSRIHLGSPKKLKRGGVARINPLGS